MAKQFNIFERTKDGIVYKDKVVESDINLAFYKTQRLIASLFNHAGVKPKYPDQTPRFFAVPCEAAYGE